VLDSGCTKHRNSSHADVVIAITQSEMRILTFESKKGSPAPFYSLTALL
jgi:hypothetical protein